MSPSSTIGSGAISRRKLASWRERFFAPVDVASLALFRILFGAIQVWEVGRYFSYDWISRYYFEPTFHFTYYGFEWVRPWPGIGMYVHFVVLGILASCITVGLFYRWAASLYAIGFGYVFLLDQAHYLNHFYLVTLLSALLAFLPCHRAWSLDALRNPRLRSGEVSGWALWTVRWFIAMVYFFAGVAKINPDWLRAQPMTLWMEGKRALPLVGDLIAHDHTAWSMSYGGLLFDLLAGPALLWRRTRVAALLVGLAFHLTNEVIFTIGIFPWMMLASSLLFLEPDWPRRLLARLPKLPTLPKPPRAPDVLPTARHRRWIGTAVALWFIVHALVPLRHWLYPGNPSWTEEGHRFAWHMMLRTKSGHARFRVVDPDRGEEWWVDPESQLTSRQANKLKSHPGMILQFAHHLAEQARADGHARVAVYADIRLGLNGRPAQVYVDPTVDLTREERSLRPLAWIRPIEHPLPGWDW